jgi:DUF1365 family protein
VNSCLYVGSVRHRRFGTPSHEFDYRLFMTFLDLDELEEAFAGKVFWSLESPNAASFRRADFLGDASVPLNEAVRELVQQRTGRSPQGPIRLLTSLRYWGLSFNPVSFYYCYDASDERVECVVAEITNTPWGERHAYVLPLGEGAEEGRLMRHRFAKAFHVSPFIGMDVVHDWRFSEPGERLSVQMENFEEDARTFDATLMMERRPWTSAELARCLASHPFMSGKVVAGIYWQALRLRLKGAPFFPHPKHRIAAAAGRES